jgi:hypothetical protein
MVEKLAKYNKLWAVIVTGVLMAIFEQFNIDINKVLEIAVIGGAVWAVPNRYTPVDAVAGNL